MGLNLSKARILLFVLLPSLVSCFFIAGTSSAALTVADCETCHQRTYLDPPANTVTLFPKIVHHDLINPASAPPAEYACTFCHTHYNPNCITCHENPATKVDQNGYHLLAHTRISIATDCVACHASPQIIETTHLENCFGCHLSTDTRVSGTIETGKAGNPVNCNNCHDAHDFGLIHDISETAGCAGCHDALTGDDVGIKAVHDSAGTGSCSTCHNSTTATYAGGRFDYYLNTSTGADALECSNCHLPHSFADNHDISESDTCIECHDALNGQETGIEAVHNTATNGAGSCNTCHSSTTLTYAGERFNYYLNTSTGTDALECSNCHQPHSFVDNHDISQATGCSDCHGTLDTEAQIEAVHDPAGTGACVTCHTDSGTPASNQVQSYINNNVADTLTCANCHAPHVFNDVHSITESPARCKNCHLDLNTTLGGIDAEHDNGEGSAGSCDTCHQSTRTDVQAFINAKAPVDCDSCHTDIINTAHTTNHDKTVVPDSACLECHVKNVANEHVGRIHSTDGHVISCEGCHADSAYNSQIQNGIAGNDVSCNDCHFPNVSLAIHLSVHKVTVAAACSVCHTGLDSMAAIDAVHNVPTNGDSSCSTCHSSTRTDVMAAIAAKAPVDCTACHGDGHDFDLIHDITETGGCVACHTELDGTKVGIEAVHDTPRNGAGSCNTCHNSADTTTRSYIDDEASHSLTCTSCHDAHDAATDHNMFNETGCTTCHGDPDTSGYRTSPWPIEQLLAIHEVTRSSSGPSCATCHNSTEPYAINAIAAGRAGTQVNCDTCHKRNPGTTNTIARHSSLMPSHANIENDTYRDDNGCTDCHLYEGFFTWVDPYSADPHPGCEACHQSTRQAVLDVVYNGTFVPYPTTIGCNLCHNADEGSRHVPLDPPSQHDQLSAGPTCGTAGCHQGPFSYIEGLHEVTTNSSGPACATCHNSTDTQVEATITTGMAGTPVNCSNCHGDHVFDTVHSISLSPSQSPFYCTGCHGNPFSVEDAHDLPTNGPGPCATCHNSTTATYAGSQFDTYFKNNSADTLDCWSCHIDHGQDAASVAPSHDFFADSVNCTNCHDTDTGEGRLLVHIYRVSNPIADCYECHTNSRNVVKKTIADGIAGTTVTCEDCHTGNVGDVKTHGLDAASAYELHNNLGAPDSSCADCHETEGPFPAYTRILLHPECETCHASDKSDVNDAIDAGKGLSTMSQACEDCHTGPPNGAIDHGTDAGGAAAVHNKFMDTATCTTCHETSDPATRLSIHPDCVTCHKSADTAVKAAIASGQAGNNVSCGDCHDPDIKDNAHTTNHDKTVVPDAGCLECHVTNVANEHVGRIYSSDGHVISCEGCHLDSAYDSFIQSGIDGNEVSCEKCHFFPVTPAGHLPAHKVTVAADCSACHTGLDSMVAIDAVHNVPTNGDSSCSTCHNSDRPDVMAAIAAKAAVDCTSCHASGHGAQDHDMFVIEPESCYNAGNCHTPGDFDGVVQMHRNDCTTCHSNTESRYVDVITAGKAGTQVDCATCHIGHHSEITNVPECNSCHPFTSEYISLTDNPVTNMHWTALLNMECNTCHTRGGPVAQETINTLKVYETGSCANCHELVEHDLGASHDTVTATAGCADCHGDTSTFDAFLTIHDSPTNGAGSCATCHESTRTEIVDLINDVRWHNTTRVIECADCHTAHSFAGSHDISETAGCVSCHTDLDGTKVGIEAVHNTSRNGAGSCNTCHNSSDTTTRGYIDDVASHSLTCTSCHAAHSFVGDHDISEAAGCSGCHDGLDGSEASIETVHDTATNGAGSCATCHNSTTATYAGAQFAIYINNNQADTLTCANCHAAHSQTHSNISSNDPCWACHVQSNDVIAVVHKNDCLRCHTSTDPNVEAAIAAGSANCSTCHVEVDSNGTKAHILQHDMTDAPDPACLDCHVQNVLIGHVINRNSGCGACHNDSAYSSQIEKGKGGETVTCNDCHFPAVTFTSHTAQHDTTTLPDTLCAACHNANIAFEHVNNRSLECVVCHNNPDSVRAGEIEPVIASGMLGNAVNCSDCHTGPFDHTSVHDMTDVPSQDCAECHNPNVVIEHVGRIHSDGHEISCADCHENSAYDAIIQSGRDGNKVVCTDCHTGINHSSSHSDTNVPAPICENCHDPNVYEEHVTVRNRDCDICHNPTYQQVIDQGVANQITVTCTTCHVTPDHHNNDTARTGMCITCHADPRPLVNDPQQLACRQCHVDSQGYVKTSSPSPSHKYNTDPSLSVRKIDDFGACFACHAPIPWHAKPSSTPDCRYDTSLTVPGRGTFNIFRSQFQRRKESNDRYESCENKRNNYSSPNVSFSWFPIVYQGDAMNVPAFDPAQPFPAYPHNRIKAIGNCGNCHTVGTVVSVTHGNDCVGCHLSAVKTVQNVISWGRAGNDVNCYSCHGEGGHEAQHDMTELTQPSCSSCHVDNVVAEHLDNPNLTCATCHNNPAYATVINNGKNGFKVTCFDCHGTADHLTLHSATNVDMTGCADCHNPNVVTEHVVKRSLDCVDCHESNDPDVMDTIAGANGSVTCSDCHGPTDHAAAHDKAGTKPGSNCKDCHSTNVVTEHVTNQGMTCGVCHDNPIFSPQITSGKNGTLVICEDCHGQNAGNHEAAHDMVGVPSAGCATTCHDANVVVEHVTDRGFTCADCHDNPAYTTVINNGKNGTYVTCYDCHGANSHHNTAEAQSGDCTFCHADPRLDVDPNAPVGQLACVECHGPNQHNNGGPIQDFGACFACHTPAPYHAKPNSRPRDCYSGGPGQGSFNIFSSEFGGGDEHNRRNDRCENRESDYRNPAISFSWVTIFDYFTTNKSWDVPTFGTGGGGNDSVNITQVSYDSRRQRITVYAENSMGNNATLTANYRSNSYPMSWSSYNNRWQVTISTSSCSYTVEVVSSAGGSDTSNVSGCR